MAGYDPEKITFFAKTDARGQQVPFGIKAKDRQRHMYVIGKTGMGKSTLLENMAAQDLQTGEGMAFIDPHGSAIEVLLEYVPEDRLDDVVYFAPFDMENPIAFNIMEDVGIDKRHLVVSGLMSTFKKIWVDAWSARMEYILTNALLALIEYPGTTLLSVNRMLADKAYRDKVVDNVKDPAVKAYWVDEFASYTERFAAEALPAIQNKIGQFTGNPLIRNIIGQPKSSFDVREMMDNKKILLINLSKGLVGETNADLIGSMLITKIYLAAMSRAELPPAQMKQMPNFYFYVDEFQSFANATFANILSEARKYHLNLIIAHQYVQQMEEEIRDAVFGNVGTTISFRVGPFDAEVLETVFAPEFEATDLVNLGFAQIYLSLMIDGVGSRPFSAVTLPPVQTPEKSHKHMAIKRSQQNFARPRAEVEQAVVDSHSPDKRIDDAKETGGGNKGGFTKPSFTKKVGTDQSGPTNKKSNKPNHSHANQSNQSKRGNKPPVKTAEDLKDILAGMTNQPNQSNQPKSDRQPQRPKESPGTDIAPSTTTNHQPAPATTDPAAAASVASMPTQPQPKPKTSAQVHPTKQSTQSTPPPATKSASTAPASNSQSAKHQTTSVTKESDQSHQPLSEPNAKTKPASPKKTPQQPTQTADDLRAVLAKLANKANPPATPKHTQSQSHHTSQSQPSADTKRSSTPLDLQQTLQKMVANKNQHQDQSNRPATTNQKQPNPQRHSHPKSQSQPPKEDLKTALAKVVDQAGVSPQPTPPKQSQANTTAPRSAPPDTQSATPAAEPSPTLYKQSSEPAVGGIRQPAFTPHQYADGPDINTAKKILRHSGKERPPGT